MDSTLGNKHFLLIGRLLAITQPEKARELLSHYGNTTSETPSLQLIPHYFTRFCQTQNLSAHNFIGSTNRESADQRRLFVSVMIRIYSPWIHQQHSKVIRPPRGLITAISKELGCGKNAISMQLREVIIQERVYEEYREKVQELTKQIISHEKQKRA